MSALLPVAAIAAIAAIGAAGTARGERREVRARRAAGSLAKGAPPPLFHATSYQAVEGIARQGLLPARGGSTFGAYARHSRGRVFLAKDPDAAKDWFGKVGDMLEANASDDSELEELVPVLLRINGRWRGPSKVDPVGDQDVPGSVFVTERIPPEDISYWRPGKGWTSLAAWGADPVEEGVLRWEEDDGARWPILRGTYDPGGFKPSSDAQFGRAWAKPKAPLRPSSLRVIWRGDAEATAREVLGALYPDRPGMVAALLPHAIGGDGLPDENLLNVKAQQLGYKGGVEIVGLTGLPPAERALLRGSRAKYIQGYAAKRARKREARGQPQATIEIEAHGVDAPTAKLLIDGEVGHLQVSRVDRPLSADSELEEGCKQSVRALRRLLGDGSAPVFLAWRSGIRKEHRGFGHGVRLYSAMLDFLRDQEGRDVILIPESCAEDGSTSASAERVWTSIRQTRLSDFPATTSRPIQPQE